MEVIGIPAKGNYRNVAAGNLIQQGYFIRKLDASAESAALACDEPKREPVLGREVSHRENGGYRDRKAGGTA